MFNQRGLLYIIFCFFISVTICPFVFAKDKTQSLLDWPVELNKAPYQFGAGTAQFVETLSKYFHTGQDIVADAGAEVITPVSGRVEAGFYDYKDFDNGHSEKVFYSIKHPSKYPDHIKSLRTFFEVAVIDDFGRRYEFHHIDAETLPSLIKKAALNGASIKAGTSLGYVVSRGLKQFGTLYDHIHYNIIDPSGVYINPFYVSKHVEDNVKPKIGHVFYKKRNENISCGFHQGLLLKSAKKSDSITDPEYLIFEGSDKLSNNKIAQALTKIKIIYDSDIKIENDEQKYENLVHDFSKKIDIDTDIRELYYAKFCIGDQKYPLSLKGSVNNKFYYKVPISNDFKGNLIIEVFDFKENKESQSFKIE